MNPAKRTELCRFAGRVSRASIRSGLLVCCSGVVSQHLPVLARQNPDPPSTSLQHTPPERDGQSDFDFEIGTWKTHVRRLLHPLTGSTTWVEYEGIRVVRKIWDGHANLVELVADGPSGHFEGHVGGDYYDPNMEDRGVRFLHSRTVSFMRRYR
jgi:hypothetical protein